MTFGSDSDTAMSSMRPPMLAGPIERKRKLWSSGSDDWLIGGDSVAAGAWPCASGRTARPARARAAIAKANAALRYKRMDCKVIDALYDDLGASAYRYTASHASPDTCRMLVAVR